MIEIANLLDLDREITRRSFVRRMFAMGAGFAASGAIVRAAERLAAVREIGVGSYAERQLDVMQPLSPFGAQVDNAVMQKMRFDSGLSPEEREIVDRVRRAEFRAPGKTGMTRDAVYALYRQF